MRLTLKPILRLLGIFCLTALVLVSCSGEGGESPAAATNRVEFDPAVTIKPDADGQTVLLITGKEGTSWSAEITAGSDWVSFSALSTVTTAQGSVGSSQAAREKFVYYKANRSGAERTARIAFTFEGEDSQVLELVQYSASSGDNIYETGQASVWPEIPLYREGSDYQYVTHYAEINGSNARNYTMCFDKSTYTACWVAYPLHKVHTGSGRPDDPWAYDPKISSSYQANLARGSYSGGYQRGHQIPNADRNGVMEMCYQTFYCSNATPQNGSLNTGVWSKLEGRVRDYICSDTLYVVTGAFFANRGTSTTDKDGKECPVPTNYFKVLVRTVKGNIRKKGDLLSDYSESQLKSIGFWVENRNIYSEVSSSMVKSVEEIEKLTGFTFFPQVPDAVKRQKAPLEWGIN